MHDIVAITVNYKMKEVIARMLEGLKRDAARSGLSVLCVVVDNNSQDNIRELLLHKHTDVEFIASPANVGFGKANNLAMRRFDAKYYFIVNPDVTFQEGESVLRGMHDFMEAHPRVGMTGPKLLNNDGSLQYSCYRFPRLLAQPFRRLGLDRYAKRIKRQADHVHMKDFNHAQTQPVDWVMGSAMFVRGKAVKEVGHFDDRFFMYFEDCDWCRRFWRAGWPVYYHHAVVLQHTHNRLSAESEGTPRALHTVLTNAMTREHIKSWLQYFWKWRKDPLERYWPHS